MLVSALRIQANLVVCFSIESMLCLIRGENVEDVWFIYFLNVIWLELYGSLLLGGFNGKEIWWLTLFFILPHISLFPLHLYDKVLLKQV